MIEHRHFTAFPDYLRAGDLVVLNDTRVIPARVFADGGRVELLFLEALGENAWKCLVKPGRQMRIGARVSVLGNVGEVREILPEGERVIVFRRAGGSRARGRVAAAAVLRAASGNERRRALPDRLCARPRGRGRAHRGPAFHAGAARAPAACLSYPARWCRHLSAGASGRCWRNTGCTRSVIVCPRKPPWRSTQPRASIAIGTTTTRVLEACAREGLPLTERAGSTDIFIHPPYEFRVIRGLLTNFHLPKSTLLMLVSAFAGRELVMRAYEEAVRERYRFYSYGDCMLIL